MASNLKQMVKGSRIMTETHKSNCGAGFQNFMGSHRPYAISPKPFWRLMHLLRWALMAVDLIEKKLCRDNHNHRPVCSPLQQKKQFKEPTQVLKWFQDISGIISWAPAFGSLWQCMGMILDTSTVDAGVWIEFSKPK